MKEEEGEMIYKKKRLANIKDNLHTQLR